MGWRPAPAPWSWAPSRTWFSSLRKSHLTKRREATGIIDVTVSFSLLPLMGRGGVWVACSGIALVAGRHLGSGLRRYVADPGRGTGLVSEAGAELSSQT